MTAYVNYPLTAADDDEFFDAPAGSTLINSDGEVTHGKVGDGWDWRSSEEYIVQAGELWQSLMLNPAEPFGGVKPGLVLRVPLDYAVRRDLCEGGREAAEARAEARLASWMGRAK